MPITAQDRIQDVALRLFAEKGGTQITVSALAEAAGIARGTVQQHRQAARSVRERGHEAGG